MTARVFVSYCHDDVASDSARLVLFLNYLKQAGGTKLDILVDRGHQSASIGSNLKSFMEQIDEVDAVIILATPGYKKRVQRRGNSGVYFEYRRILDRYRASREDGEYERSFLLLPLTFTSEFEDSCPSEVREVICADVSWISVIPDTDPPKCRRDIELRLRPLAQRLAGRVSAISTIRMSSYADQLQKVFRYFLFQDTKSRFDRPENYKYLRPVFVKTHTYYKIKNQQVRFLVGRKGAGKSALTHVLPLMSEPLPTVKVRIEFEDMPFSMCFNILQTNPGVASDLSPDRSPAR